VSLDIIGRFKSCGLRAYTECGAVSGKYNPPKNSRHAPSKTPLGGVGCRKYQI